MKNLFCIIISFSFVLISASQRRNLIFESNFDTGHAINAWHERSLANTWSATICDSQKYAGRSVVRFELRKGVDTLFGVRAELGTASQSVIGESWYGFSNYFPAAYSPDPSGEIITQWQAKPDFNLGENWRSPPLALEIKNDRFYLAIRWSSAPVNSNASSSVAYLDLGPVAHVKWTDWVIHAKWRYDNTGSLKIWKNGSLIVNRPDQPLGYNDVHYPYFKIGIYKWEWQGPSASTTSGRVYYADEIRIGNSSASYYDVAPFYSRLQFMECAAINHTQKETSCFSQSGSNQF